MATIKATGLLDGTSCYAQVVVTQISRTKNSIKLSCVVSSGYTGNGYTEAGYESYTGNFILSGNGFTTKTTNFTAKNKQTADTIFFIKTYTFIVKLMFIRHG